MRRALKAKALSVVRRGDRLILFPPAAIGFGNLLYIWLQASAAQASGRRVFVRDSGESNSWRHWFPSIFDQLLLSPEEIRFRDRRTVGQYFQGFNIDFSHEELNEFLDTRLMREGEPFRGLVESSADAETVTINVRRGDYYSVDKFRKLYSFDIATYVRVALLEIRKRGHIETIRIVSDDVDWCRKNLAFIHEQADVIYTSSSLGVAEQLALLAGSRRLILTNSTFSYWGGYLSSHYYANSRGSSADIVVPWFHSRLFADSGTYHADPTWTMIREIPGGWEPHI